MPAPSAPSYPTGAAARYPSDVDDATWALIAPILAQSRGRGRPRAHPDRVIYNAIRYVLRGGIPWRLLPDPFPAWPTVYSRFRRWADAGLWERLTDALRAALRIEVGRDPEPGAGILDSQSAPTGPGGGAIGYDAGKRVKGRKRHLVVDTLGTVLAALVTPASAQDPVAAPAVLAQAKAKSARPRHIWGDGRYRGPLVLRAARALGLTVEVVSPPPGPERLPGPAGKVDRRTDLRLARTLSTARARLGGRLPVGVRPDLRRDQQPDRASARSFVGHLTAF